jgi:hypothetical protein
MMKLYIGVSKAGRGRLLVARRQGAKVAYEMCWKGSLENLEALTLAILLEHWGDAEQARKVCAGFVRLMAARLRADFWTLRESEIAAAIAAVR